MNEGFDCSLLDSMRRELSGEFASKLDETKLTSILDAEKEWLWSDGETCETKVLEERLASLEQKLHTEFKEFFDAKESHRLEVEKQLEEESNMNEKVRMRDWYH